MAIVYNFRADEAPPLQVASTLALAATSAATDGGTAPAAAGFHVGDTATVPGGLNDHAARLDLTARYGGGGGMYAIAYGLDLSFSGAPVVLSVAAGHALIEGLVEVAAPITGIAAAVGDNYVWLKQDGTVILQPDATPPAGKAVYLGFIHVDFLSGAANVDLSGVLYVRGGMLVRQTHDAGMPVDTPPASVVFVTITQGSTFLWNGSRYLNMDGGGGYGGGGATYFGALPHSGADPTAHDSWYAPYGVHITPGDRADIAAALAAATAAGTAAAAAQTTAASASTAASAAAVAAAAAVQTTDPRLADNRVPLPHSASHGLAGTDPVSIDSTQVADFATRFAALLPYYAVAGTNVSLSVNPTTGKMTISAAGPGGGFSGIGGSGATFPVRSNLYFEGNGVSVSDNSTLNRTEIVIPIGSPADFAAGSITPGLLADGGTTADSTKFYRGDGTWQAAPSASANLQVDRSDYSSAQTGVGELQMQLGHFDVAGATPDSGVTGNAALVSLAATGVAAGTYTFGDGYVVLDAQGRVTEAASATGGGGGGGGGGTGTVTSVSLAAPGIFTVTGSPITVSGTLTLALQTQAANQVWAGPTSGSAAAPTFRSLVAADLPAATGSAKGAVLLAGDVAPNGSGGVKVVGIQGVAFSSAAPTTGQVPIFNGTAYAPSALPQASSGAFGVVKVDGTTITASGGVISAVGGGGGGGSVPSGTDTQTLRFSGTTLTADSTVTNDGTTVRIGGSSSSSVVSNDGRLGVYGWAAGGYPNKALLFVGEGDSVLPNPPSFYNTVVAFELRSGNHGSPAYDGDTAIVFCTPGGTGMSLIYRANANNPQGIQCGVLACPFSAVPLILQDGGGKVGIGSTAAPTETLDVTSGNARVAGTVNAEGGFQTFDAGSLTTVPGITDTIPLAKLTSSGSDGSLTIIGGIVTNVTYPT